MRFSMPAVRSSKLILVLALLVPAAWEAVPAAHAGDDEDEPSFESKIIRGFLGVGNGGIDYRERSPLVIPPSGDLPPPESAPAVASTPAWPHDPDKKRHRKAANGPAIDSYRESARNLSPEELKAGKKSVGASGPAPTLSDNQMARPLTPKDMGETQSVFSWFSSKPAAEEGKFEKEPTRTKLTEPPSGYRTPSPSQPYAAPKDAPGSWFKPFNLLDRGTADPK